MLLVLDNYDSFTYNLVQYAGELGADPVVYRNDALTVAEVLALEPAAIVISPGPCTPGEAGISVPLVRAAAGRVPLLGVCLGHQAIGEAFGGRVVRADRLMHGKTTLAIHTGHPLFEGIPSPVEVMRYHSLVVSPEQLPAELEIVAWSSDRPRGTGDHGPRPPESSGLRRPIPPRIGCHSATASVCSANFLSLAGIGLGSQQPVTV